MTQEEIQDLIKFVAKSGVNEVEIERKDFKITIKSPSNGTKRGKAAAQFEPQTVQMAMPAGMTMPMQMPAAMPAQAPAPAPAAAASAPAPACSKGGRCWLDRNQEPHDWHVLPQAFP